MSLGLYLHIPYCFSKCRYCDFYSHPGERGVPDAYVEALLRELSRFAPEAPLQPDTLYFGGGTPSLLRPEQAKRLIDAARPMPGAEITLEANPETVTEESLAGFREAGVNRISFGVQSARDTQLRTLGRPHTAKQARAAFAAARRAGFTNISGDIMLALPHYTEAEFDETLELIEDGGAGARGLAHTQNAAADVHNAGEREGGGGQADRQQQAGSRAAERVAQFHRASSSNSHEKAAQTGRAAERYQRLQFVTIVMIP